MKLEYAFAFVCASVLVGCASPESSQANTPRSTEANGETAEAATNAKDHAAARRAPFQANVIQAALDNEAFRRVLFTGARSQLVVMTIPKGGNIGAETHRNVEQLIFIASGTAKAILDGKESSLVAGDVVVVTPGTKHDIVNTGNDPLRIYTVYAPANHIDKRVHETKTDADDDKDDEAYGESVK